MTKLHHAVAGLGLAVSVLTGSATWAEPIDYFQVDGVRYDNDIPIPEDVLGFGLGERPVRHDKMVEYLTAVAEASDRISVETIGYSHEGRPILFFVVTSPNNHDRLDEIREAHLERLEGDFSPPEDADQPAVIWINYGVHGAESSGMDAAMPALYHFAAAQGSEIDRTLDESVILITAIFNPDGHARRIDHVETFGGAVDVTDPAHQQHQLWVEARTNHYWFDLNRQWLLLTQPEPKAWIEKWRQWKPQVTADYHEMGSNASYYFHPGEPKRRNPLIPELARELTLSIAEQHAEWLDSEAQLYYSEQGFDNFYVGKGSTYPQVNGSLGILFEAGAARGGRIETPSGERTYADNIRTHFGTTLTTVAGALAIKDDLEDYQREFFRSALDEAAADERRAFVFTTSGDAERRRRFVELLLSHDVEVHELAQPLTVDELTFEPDTSYIVPAEQRQYRMVRAIFDRVTEFEEDIFYDVSGWTIPLAYDLDYVALGDRSFMRDQYNSDADVYAVDLLGARVESPPAASQPEPPQADYGYIFEWSEYYAPRALHRLLDHDVLVRIATSPATIVTSEGELEFNRGAVFVPLARQTVDREQIDDLISQIAQDDGIAVHAVESGLSVDPGVELGGPSFEPVQQPRVLLVFDDGLARYDSGEIWHLLDHEMHMPVTLRRKDDLQGLDWSRYTHLVMVGGNNVALAEPITDRVRQWVAEQGGTVVAMRQSAQWAQDILMADPAQANGDEDTSANGSEDEADSETEAEEPLRLAYDQMGVRDAEHIIGGAIFASDLDITHPLGFGYSDAFLPTHRNTTLTLEWPEDNPFGAPAVYVEDDVLLSGYASDKRLDEIAGTPMAVTHRMGQGSVILLADNPVFRATFLGTSKLFLNAIFFDDLIDSPFGDYAHGD